MEKFKSDAMASVHEMMAGFHKHGVISDEKMREFDELCIAPPEKLSPAQIRELREQNDVSRTTFAYYLGVSPHSISHWESGKRSPSGPSLRLLAIVKNKGLSALF
mgnify:FL=1